MGDLIVKAHQWKPSELVVSDPVEICIPSRTGADLIDVVSKLFKISPQDVEMAPCSSSATHCSVLDMQDHMRWVEVDPEKDIESYPLMLHDDGAQFFLRDKSEKMMEIDSEKRRQILDQEASQRPRSFNGPLNNGSNNYNYNNRVTSRPKEKSLKIYTHQSSPPPNAQSTQPTNNGVPSAPATSPTSNGSVVEVDD